MRGKFVKIGTRLYNVDQIRVIEPEVEPDHEKFTLIHTSEADVEPFVEEVPFKDVDQMLGNLELFV